MYVSKSIIASTLVLALSQTAFAAPTATTSDNAGLVSNNNNAAAPLPTVTVVQTVAPDVYASMLAAQQAAATGVPVAQSTAAFAAPVAQATSAVQASSGVVAQVPDNAVQASTGVVAQVPDTADQVDYSTAPMSSTNNMQQADTTVPTATAAPAAYDFGSQQANTGSVATQQPTATTVQASTAGAANVVDCSKWYSNLRYLSCSKAGRWTNSLLGRQNATPMQQTSSKNSSMASSSARATATPTGSPVNSSASSVLSYAGSSAASRVAQVGLTVVVLAISGSLAL